MDTNKIIQLIQKAAKQDQKKRNDIRYKKAMAFLVRKGLLKSNKNFDKLFFSKNKIADFIWAGQNVEPRILEVLPSAVARLPKSFIYSKSPFEDELKEVVHALKMNSNEEPSFLKISYDKIKFWMNFPILDGRTKVTDQKKIMKTFRLSPASIKKIKILKETLNLSEADVIESLLLKSS